MKRFTVEIDNLVVDAAGIAPLRVQQFRSLVEESLRKRLEKGGLPPTVYAKKSVAVVVTSAHSTRPARGAELAGHVVNAIHEGLTRKA